MLFRADEWALRNVLIGNTPREPPLAGTEAEHLVGALDRLRTTFGGLLKHLALMEDY
jgi:hypothetical protein